MNRLSRRKGWLLAASAVLVASTAAAAGPALARADDAPGAASGLGQLTGLLPRDHLTVESALQVDLSKQTVRLPLYPGKANGQTVWYVLLDSSDAGLAHDLGINYAPKLANLGTGCPDCVQTVTLESPTLAQNPFGPAVVDFQGAPDFSPTRVATPGPDGFPLAAFQPGAVAGPGYSPFVKIAGSDTVYSAPIVATGDGPFDVVHHTNTGDRVLGVHIAGPSAPGQFAESWVDILFVKGFDAGQPIVYISTDAGQPLTAVLERSTYVPALDQAAYNGGDDFHQRPNRRGQHERARVHPPGQRRPRLRGRQRRQHRADQRAAQRRRPTQRIRRLPHRDRPPACPGLQPALGCPTRTVDRQGDQGRTQHAPDRRGASLQPGRHPTRPDHRPRRRAIRVGRCRHQLRGDRLHRQSTNSQPRRPRPRITIPTKMN